MCPIIDSLSVGLLKEVLAPVGHYKIGIAHAEESWVSEIMPYFLEFKQQDELACDRASSIQSEDLDYLQRTDEHQGRQHQYTIH